MGLQRFFHLLVQIKLQLLKECEFILLVLIEQELAMLQLELQQQLGLMKLDSL